MQVVAEVAAQVHQALTVQTAVQVEADTVVVLLVTQVHQLQPAVQVIEAQVAAAVPVLHQAGLVLQVLAVTAVLAFLWVNTNQ